MRTENSTQSITPHIYWNPVRCHAFTLLELLVVMGIVALLATLSAGGLARAKAKANDTHCRGNLRQLGLLLQIYCDSNDGRFPTITTESNQLAGSLGRLLGDRQEATALLRCKADRDSPIATTSYVWNNAFSGTIVDSPRRVGDSGLPLLSDKKPWHGARNCLMPDHSITSLRP